MSNNAQVGAIQAIYYHNIVAVIKHWERHIIVASSDIIPDIPEEELAQFRSQVSNLDNIWEFMEQ